MTHRLLCCASSLECGGSERQLWQLATGIHRRHWPTQVYLLYRRGMYLEKLPVEIPVHAWDKCHLTDLNQGRVGRNDLGAASALQLKSLLIGWLPGSIHWQQVRHLTQVLQENQIQVVYDRGYHCTLVTAAACQAARVGRVSVIVSPPSRDFGLSSERFKGSKYRLLRRAYSDPKAVVLAVSQPTADDAISYFRLPKSSITVVPNSVDTEVLQQAALLTPAGMQSLQQDRHVSPVPSIASSTVSESTGSESKEREFLGNSSSLNADCRVMRVVLAARMTVEKRHAFLLEAAARWRACFQATSASLVIDFLGSGPLENELRAVANRLGLQDVVRFHGHQENPYPWIARASAVCIPSSYEGMSNVALEAMSLGSPVIASAASQLNSLLGSHNERGLILSLDSHDKLAEAIQTVATKPEMVQRMTQAAQEWVRENHSTDRWLDKMQAIFDRSRQLLS